MGRGDRDEVFHPGQQRVIDQGDGAGVAGHHRFERDGVQVVGAGQRPAGDELHQHVGDGLPVVGEVGGPGHRRLRRDSPGDLPAGLADAIRPAGGEFAFLPVRQAEQAELEARRADVADKDLHGWPLRAVSPQLSAVSPER